MQRTASHDQEWIDELLPEQETYEAKGKDAWGLAKDLLKLANVVRISIWHQGRPLASIPVVYGGVVATLFPFISLFSMISLLALDCRIVVEKK
ncbi:DUF4342 domain-containing protein [Ammoniphilus sp. YIM 78166]|uniref:DUF4342 domain-containing protein n=1 Tax=Ammoniphilus sp. YIM 78166 TaxID=1644106 RepID=UPI0014316B9F|nr:DUF4342 domain-containing protein [Ammoniphilus sp. YIM 78166]